MRHAVEVINVTLIRMGSTSMLLYLGRNLSPLKVLLRRQNLFEVA